MSQILRQEGAAAALLLLAALALQATSLPVPRAPPPEPADSAVGGDYRLGDVHHPGPGAEYWYQYAAGTETFDFCGTSIAGGVTGSPYCAPTRACGRACDIIWNDMKIVATLADAIAYVDAVVQPRPYDPPNPKAASLCCGEQYRLRSYLDECAQYPEGNFTTCGQLPFGKVALALASVAASSNGGEIPLPGVSDLHGRITVTYMDASLAFNSRMDLLSKETLAQLFYVSSSTAAEVLSSLRVAYVKKTAASWQGARSPEPPRSAASPAEAARE
ncbi:hypothetical protein T484DRAFT_1989965 [Baffinella frigidus]|nr:hypothetical protein T484DRAFT_1989965 [Cryptophyta sp. CCMP2293]